MIVNEAVIHTAPVTIRRRAKWSDCDPAGVVYTGTFCDYVISAAELFYGTLFDTTPQRAKNLHGFGTPTRALSFDFQKSLYPDEEFEMTVEVTEIGTRTFTLAITGRGLDSSVLFVAKLTPVCVAREVRRSIEMPAILREALQRYVAACAPGRAGEDES